MINPNSLVVQQCQLKDIRSFIEKYHYSHNVKGVKITYCFKVTYMNDLVGGVIFGAMSGTGWKKFVTNEKEIIEMRRLVLLDDCGKNSESKVISKCLQMVHKLDKNLQICVTYSDPRMGHMGIIYRGSSFEYVGKTQSDRCYEDVETGKIHHSRALRVKLNGDYAPFTKVLREKLKNKLLRRIHLPGKFCYVYHFYNRPKVMPKFNPDAKHVG